MTTITTHTPAAPESKKRRALPEWMLTATATANSDELKPKQQHQSRPSLTSPSPSNLLLQRLMARIERTQLARDLLERILDPPALTWGLFDYEGQEAELLAQAESGAFVLHESELMEHMSAEELVQPIVMYCPALWRLSQHHYKHDPVVLLKDLNAALEQMLLIIKPHTGTT
jgi:hypothetical protein